MNNCLKNSEADFEKGQPFFLRERDYVSESRIVIREWRIVIRESLHGIENCKIELRIVIRESLHGIENSAFIW